MRKLYIAEAPRIGTSKVRINNKIDYSDHWSFIFIDGRAEIFIRELEIGEKSFWHINL